MLIGQQTPASPRQVNRSERTKLINSLSEVNIDYNVDTTSAIRYMLSPG